jgi:5-methylcytosine-specific restriction protein A
VQSPRRRIDRIGTKDEQKAHGAVSRQHEPAASNRGGLGVLGNAKPVPSWNRFLEWRLGKLTNLRSQLAALKPKLGVTPGDKRSAEIERNARNTARAWYGTKAWAELRLAVFVRDGFVCQRTGQLCVGKHPAPTSPVANHKRPHRGDPKLFWDIDNIETVTKQVHDGLIQSEEQAIPTGRWD